MTKVTQLKNDKLTLTTGEELYVSSARMRELKDKVMEYWIREKRYDRRDTNADDNFFCVAFTKHFGWYGGWNGIMPMVYMGVMAGKISFLWEISECCV